MTLSSRAKTPGTPSIPSQAQGSFGYLQNPMMSGAGMPARRPMAPTGRPLPQQPMFEPKPLPAQANPMARSKARGF